MKELVLQSRFPPEECARRLEAVTEPDRLILSDWRFSYAILARLRDNNVRLRVRRPFFRNSYAPFFYGRFETTTGGSILRGRFQLHPFVRAFMIVWFAIAILVCGLMILTGVQAVLSGGSRPVQTPVLDLVTPLLFLGFATGLFWLFRRLSCRDEKDIRDLIQRTLETRVDGAA